MSITKHCLGVSAVCGRVASLLCTHCGSFMCPGCVDKYDAHYEAHSDDTGEVCLGYLIGEAERNADKLVDDTNALKADVTKLEGTIQSAINKDKRAKRERAKRRKGK